MAVKWRHNISVQCAVIFLCFLTGGSSLELARTDSTSVTDPFRGKQSIIACQPFEPSELQLTYNIPELLAGLHQFDSRFFLGLLQQRYPEAIKYLELCGVLASGSCTILDPYTGTYRKENFSNIFEHSVAVAFCAYVIGHKLLSLGAITSQELDATVYNALLHDATKPFEIFRRRIGRILTRVLGLFDNCREAGRSIAQAFDEIFQLVLDEHGDLAAYPAHVNYIGWFLAVNRRIKHTDAKVLCERAKLILAGRFGTVDQLEQVSFTVQDLDRAFNDSRIRQLLVSVIEYGSAEACDFEIQLLSGQIPEEALADLARAGASAGGRSYPSLLLLSESGKLLGVQGSWPELVVHLSDDMTASTLQTVDELPHTFFLTTNERLVVSGLLARVGDTLLDKGFGVDSSNQVVEVRSIKDPPHGVQPIANTMTLMPFISNTICQRIAEISRCADDLAPEKFVKDLVNDWHQRLVHRQAMPYIESASIRSIPSASVPNVLRVA